MGVAILFALYSVALLVLIKHVVAKWLLFKKDPRGNPYRRYCKKCGACQIMYQSNIEGWEDDIWWEEVYPIGDNPKCKCHDYSEYRS